MLNRASFRPGAERGLRDIPLQDHKRVGVSGLGFRVYGVLVVEPGKIIFLI